MKQKRSPYRHEEHTGTSNPYEKLDYSNVH